MNQGSNQGEKPESVITIVGGGCTGSTIAAQQAQNYMALYRHDSSLPALTIRIIDEKGSFGPGYPYSTQDDVFLLNQPTYRMSPFPDDRDHFTRWMGCDENTFASRRQYGEYLQSVLKKTFDEAAAAGIPVRLETLTGKVTDIKPDGDNVTLVQKDGTELETQSVILATGHQRGQFLSELKESDRYFTCVQNPQRVRDILKDATAQDNVVIVGTGASMMDVLGALDKIGYEGKIYAVSRDLVLPWAYDPAFYAQEREAYKPHYLNPARVRKAEDQSGPALIRRLMRDINRAERMGYGVKHVLSHIRFKVLATASPDGTKPEGFEALKRFWQKISSNATTPERYALLERLRDNGRLTFVKADVSAQNFVMTENGIFATTLGDQETFSALAVFNSASFSRAALDGPLLRQAVERGLVRVEDAEIEAGPQENPAVFVAGPPTLPQGWGVETMRRTNATVARDSVRMALSL